MHKCYFRGWKGKRKRARVGMSTGEVDVMRVCLVPGAHQDVFPPPSGDDGGGAGLPAAPAHGLPHGAAPADAGVLDEGEEPEAQVLPHRQHLGQAAPQRRLPQDGDQQLLGVSHRFRMESSGP